MRSHNSTLLIKIGMRKSYAREAGLGDHFVHFSAITTQMELAVFEVFMEFRLDFFGDCA